MTRFVKWALSGVAALVVVLFVVMLVVSGCQHGKLEDDAQMSVDAAKADAAQKVAEAKQAVVDATASLEAAIAQKADAETLASEVSKLNTALEAAKALAQTSDGALKAELEAALLAAREVVLAEGKNIALALDAEIYELMLDKADKVELADALDMLEGLVAQIEAITGEKLEFDQSSGAIAAERYELLSRLREIERYYRAGAYTDNQWTEIEKAYIKADTMLLRASNLDDAAAAISEFNVAIGKQQNDVDKLAVSLSASLSSYTMQSAKNLYDEAKSIVAGADILADLAQNYYDGTNLLEKASEIYVATVEAELDRVNAIYMVHPEALQAAGEGKIAISGADDRAALGYLENFLAELDNEGLNVNSDKRTTFELKLEIVEKLDNAQTDAQAIVNPGYDKANITFTFVNGTDGQKLIDDLYAWELAIKQWRAEYYKAQALGDTPTPENAQRAALLESLVTTMEAEKDEEMAALDAIIATYKETAKVWTNVVDAFCDTYGELDLNRVTLAKGELIKSALADYNAWVSAGNNGSLIGDIYMIEDDDDIIGNEQYEKTMLKYYIELTNLKNKYSEIQSNAHLAWNSTGNPLADNLELTIYDEDVVKALTWFEDIAPKAENVGQIWADVEIESLGSTFKLYNMEALVWDTNEEGDKFYTLFEEDGDNPAVVVEYSYFEMLVEYYYEMNGVDGIITGKAEAAKEINDAIAALVAVKPTAGETRLSGKAEIYRIYALYTAYMSDTADNSIKYDGEQTTLNNIRGFNIPDEQYLKDAKQKVDELQLLLDAVTKEDEVLENAGKLQQLAALNESVASQYPYFADPDAETAYIEAKDALKGAIIAFEDANSGDTDFNTQNLAAAKTALGAAQRIIVKDVLFGKLADLEALNTTFGAKTVFDTESGEDKVTEAEYIATLEALKLAIHADSAADYDLSAAESNHTLLAEPEASNAIAAAETRIANARVNVALAELKTAVDKIAANEYADNAEAKLAVDNAIENVNTVYTTGYTGTTAGSEKAQADATVKAAMDAAIADAIQKVELDNIAEKKAELSKINSTYPYFVDTTTEDKLSKADFYSAVEALENAIARYETNVGNKNHDDVTAAETAVANGYELYYRDDVEAAVVELNKAGEEYPYFVDITKGAYYDAITALENALNAYDENVAVDDTENVVAAKETILPNAIELYYRDTVEEKAAVLSKINSEYPYFVDVTTEDKLSKADFYSAIEALEIAIDDYDEYVEVDDTANVTTIKTTTLPNAIELYYRVAVEAAVVELNKVGDEYAYFADATDDENITKVDYEAAIEALEEALEDYDEYVTVEDAASVTNARPMVNAAKELVARDTVEAAEAELGAMTAYPYFADAVEFANDIEALEQAIEDYETVIAGLGITAENEEVTAAKLSLAKAKELLYMNAIEAELAIINKASDTAPHFVEVDKADFFDAIGRLETALEEYNTNVTNPVYTDATGVAAVIANAKELYERNKVQEALDVLNSVSGVSDAFPYFSFADATARNEYDDAAKALREAIYGIADNDITEGYNEVIGNTTKVEAAITALENAEESIKRYDNFKVFYTTYLSATTAISDATADSDVKLFAQRELSKVYNQTLNYASDMTSEELADEDFVNGRVGEMQNLVVYAQNNGNV